MQRLQNVAAVIFDFDGTLVHQTIDFQRMRTDVTSVVQQFDVHDPTILDLYVLELIAAATDYVQSRGGDGEQLRNAAYAAIETVECEAAKYAQPIPGVRDMLQLLRQQGFLVGVVTRNSRSSVLTAFSDIEVTCDVLLPRDAVKNVKPHPEHLSVCLERLGVTSGQALMVGDHPMDIVAGQQHHMVTVGVLTGSGSAEALEVAGADFVLPDVTHLLPLLSI